MYIVLQSTILLYYYLKAIKFGLGWRLKPPVRLCRDQIMFLFTPHKNIKKTWQTRNNRISLHSYLSVTYTAPVKNGRSNNNSPGSNYPEADYTEPASFQPASTPTVGASETPNTRGAAGPSGGQRRGSGLSSGTPSSSNGEIRSCFTISLLLDCESVLRIASLAGSDKD